MSKKKKTYWTQGDHNRLEGIINDLAEVNDREYITDEERLAKLLENIKHISEMAQWFTWRLVKL